MVKYVQGNMGNKPMFVAFVDNAKGDKKIIVKFKNESLADRFIDSYEYYGGILQWNSTYLSDDEEWVKKRYTTKIINGANTFNFFKRLNKILYNRDTIAGW